jgi:hypothetical protein
VGCVVVEVEGAIEVGFGVKEARRSVEGTVADSVVAQFIRCLLCSCICMNQ